MKKLYNVFTNQNLYVSDANAKKLRKTKGFAVGNFKSPEDFVKNNTDDCFELNSNGYNIAVKYFGFDMEKNIDAKTYKFYLKIYKQHEKEEEIFAKKQAKIALDSCCDVLGYRHCMKYNFYAVGKIKFVENYHKNTSFVWDTVSKKECLEVIKKRTVDYISGSLYLKYNDCVYRFADHWGNFLSVDWCIKKPRWAFSYVEFNQILQSIEKKGTEGNG